MLHALEPYFESIPSPGADVSESVRDRISSLNALRDRIARPERRIVFFGAAKTGKSSLLNSLLEVPLLPVHATRAVPLLVTLHEGTVPRAAFTGPGNTEEPVPFDNVSRTRWLVGLDQTDWLAELRIEAPLPLLFGGWSLVDTPGMFQREDVTERVIEEVMEADLAVMVLAADKILSGQERDVARQVTALLGGSVVFVVNRMDLVDPDEQEEVLGWAQRALEGSGNALVGSPRIFATATRGDGGDLPIVRAWLETIVSSVLGGRVAVLTRLGLLETSLRRVRTEVDAALMTLRQVLEELRREDVEALEREREAIRRRIAEGRVRLRTLKGTLPALKDSFVQTCVESAREAMREAPGDAAVHVPWKAALHNYADRVASDVEDVTLGLPVTPPALDLSGWIVRTDVAAKSHPVREAGMTLGDVVGRVIDRERGGRETGAALGGWLAKNLFDVDVERETLRRVEVLAGGMVPSLQAEAGRYIDRVDQLLEEADGYFRDWRRGSPRVTAAEDRDRAYAQLAAWVDRFLAEVEAIKAGRDGRRYTGLRHS